MIPHIKYKTTINNINNLVDYFTMNEIDTSTWITADLGTWGGTVSKEIIERLNPKFHYMIDPYIFYDNWNELHKYFGTWTKIGGKKTNDDLNEIYVNVIDTFKNTPNAIIVRDFAERYLPYLEDEYFDFIFNAVNLSDEGILNMMEIAYKKVKVGGYLSGYPLRTFKKIVYRLLQNYDDLELVLKDPIFLLKKRKI